MALWSLPRGFHDGLMVSHDLLSWVKKQFEEISFFSTCKHSLGFLDSSEALLASLFMLQWLCLNVRCLKAEDKARLYCAHLRCTQFDPKEAKKWNLGRAALCWQKMWQEEPSYNVYIGRLKEEESQSAYLCNKGRFEETSFLLGVRVCWCHHLLACFFGGIFFGRRFGDLSMCFGWL